MSATVVSEPEITVALPTPCDFKQGDVVGLRSGGPNMIVEDVAGRGYTDILGFDIPMSPRAFCVWFDKTDNLKRAAFDPGLLERRHTGKS